MRRSFVLLAVVFAFLASTSDADTLTVRCDEPKGVRLMGIGPAGPHEDAYSGVNPLFIMDSDSPGKAIVVFGESTVLGDLKPDEAKKFPYIATDQRYVIFEHMEHENWSYALYPGPELGIFTRVGEMPLVNVPFGAVYQAKCTFAFSKTDPPRP
jgi:hypothetical protein